MKQASAALRLPDRRISSQTWKVKKQKLTIYKQIKRQLSKVCLVSEFTSSLKLVNGVFEIVDRNNQEMMKDQ